MGDKTPVTKATIAEPDKIGLGTWRATDEAEELEAVKYAVEQAGYRHIDCAYCYANEETVGKALNDLFTRGVVKREELWITSKLWCTFHHPEDVERGCRLSMKALGVEYLDLLLIHWPASFIRLVKDDDANRFPRDEHGKLHFDHCSELDTWKAMEDLVKKGLVRNIGVSNFTINQLEKLKYSGAEIKPFTNQFEFHLYMQQDPLIDYCEKNGIRVTGYSTLGSGQEPSVLKDEVLVAISKEVGKSVAQVELRFLQKIAPNAILLAKSVHPERIKQNRELDFDLTAEQVARLKARQRCLRMVNVQKFWNRDILGDGWW